MQDLQIFYRSCRYYAGLADIIGTGLTDITQVLQISFRSCRYYTGVADIL